MPSSPGKTSTTLPNWYWPRKEEGSTIQTKSFKSSVAVESVYHLSRRNNWGKYSVIQRFQIQSRCDWDCLKTLRWSKSLAWMIPDGKETTYKLKNGKLLGNDKCYNMYWSRKAKLKTSTSLAAVACCNVLRIELSRSYLYWTKMLRNWKKMRLSCFVFDAESGWQLPFTSLFWRFWNRICRVRVTCCNLHCEARKKQPIDKQVWNGTLEFKVISTIGTLCGLTWPSVNQWIALGADCQES